MTEYPKKILLFGMQQEKRKNIMRLCRELRIPVSVVSRGRYLQPLGALAGVSFIPENHTFYEGEMLRREMMVICGLSDRELDVFLDTYRQHNIEPVAYKAVLTAANMTWTPIALFEELAREHREMTK